MGQHEDVVSGGISSITRSDINIGGEKLKSSELEERLESGQVPRVNPIPNFGNNTGHVSKDLDKTNGMSQIDQVSQSLVKGKNIKSDLLGQDAKPSSNKLDLKIDRGALVKRHDAECVAEKRSGLDLNAVAVSSCLNDDSSSVCSSRIRGNVYSESVTSNDPMKLWEAMKQNGFLSKPHGGISVTPTSCLVSSTHGGIPAPRKRGRKSKNGSDAAMMKKRKVEIARKEEVDRFAKLAAPSGLLNQLNPAIINHVRNKKQVLSIIKNVVKSVQDAENFSHPSMRHCYTKNMENVNIDASRSDFSQGFKDAMPEGNCSMRYNKEKCADGEFSEEINTVGSRFSENASSLSSEDTTDLNSSVLTVKAATVASQWLELLHQDIKGRVSALRRSKKRVRAVVTTDLPFLVSKELQADQENDPNILGDGAKRASTGDIHKIRWIALFNQLEQTLSEEERQLESWLNQVRELQSHCDRGLQSLSSDQNFLQLGTPLNSRAADALSSDKDLTVRAAAASIYSTCNFLASKENLTCT